jgi:hypothetical protein
VLTVRRARSFKSVAIGSVALAAVVLSVMFALYLRYVHYDRVAVRHLPPHTAIAVRVEVEQAIFYEPIRRHLLPLFGGPGESPTQADARLARIEARSRLSRGDLREIVFGRGEAQSDWVVVLGGIFPGESGPPRLVQALTDETGWTASPDGRRAEHGPTGTAVARASDGAVVIASSPRVLSSALPAAGEFEALGLPPTGAGGFALSRAALSELVRWPWVLASGDLPAALSELAGVSGQFSPGDRIRLAVTFRSSDGKAAERSASGIVELLRARGRLVESRSSSLLRAALDRASVRREGSTAVLSLEWERPEVDYALATLADTIRSHW